MKLADYVADYLAKLGIRQVFVVTGGAVAHLIDSVGRHSDIDYVCTTSEQPAAMAVDGYVRVTGGLGAAMVTTGPGVVNLMTGIACLYYDSLPGIFIAGQVSRSRLGRNAPGVRQLGFQESPHVDLVRPLTKYAVLVDDPSRIRYELEKATWIAREGRPGPVLIDICDDVQREDIDPDALEGFVPPAVAPPDETAIGDKIERMLTLLAEAERPVLVVGAAARIAGVEREMMEFADRLQIPLAMTWAAMDLIAWDDPRNIGGFGVSSTRRGNFAIQNADLVISVGSRLDTHATGMPLASFARGAKKVVVELDSAELDKFARQKMPIDITIQADIRDFLRISHRYYNTIKVRDISDWYAHIARLRERYPSCPPEFRAQRGTVNPYVFMDVLSDELSDNDILVTDCGANLIQTFQGMRIKRGQRVFSAFNNSPMGYSLSAAIGACFAADRRPVICITGDGGLQVNMQELGTVVRYDLPIKIFLFNNHGYGIIQQTQEDWLEARYFAARPQFGLMDPDYVRIAQAFGMHTLSVNDHTSLGDAIRDAIRIDGPVLCNLEFAQEQRIVPMLKAGRPIEDPLPLLDRDEFRENMIVAPMPASRES